MKRIRLVLLLVLGPVWVCSGVAQQTATSGDAVRIERLAALGKLWGAIKYFHPYLGYRTNIDWDKAVVEAIPKVNAAKNAEEYAADVDSMLQALGDPATHVVRKRPAVAAAAGVPLDPSFHQAEDGLLLVSMRNYGAANDYLAVTQRAGALKDAILTAKAVVFDLRADQPAGEDDAGTEVAFSFAGLAGVLTGTAVRLPGERRRMHSGFVAQRGASSSTYESAFYIAQRAYLQSDGRAKDLPVVFLVNRNSTIPAAVLGLQAAGKAAIVAEGETDDSTTGATKTFRLPEGVDVIMRVGEVMYPDGGTGFQPDITVAPSNATGDQNPAYQQAVAVARNFKREALVHQRVPASAAVGFDSPYQEMKYPAAEYRILAAFRIWTIIHYFFPYADLIGEDWDAVLRDFLPRMEKAGNELEYGQAVTEMVTHFHDGHGFVRSRAVREFLGATLCALRLRMIEGQPVVTGFYSEADAHAAGAEIGDVVVKVDGQDAMTLLEQRGRYVSASTPQWRGVRASGELLAGPDGSTVAVTVRGRDGKPRDLRLPRKKEYFLTPQDERSGEPYRMLPGNIGYADLDRLEVSMVDEMFEKFKDTRAIIFDDRAYPKGTAWAIAPRLSQKNSVIAARFTRRSPNGPDDPQEPTPMQWSTQGFYQKTPHTDLWRYKGKTVMLIDERAVSQAEHTGLFLEAAGGTKFVGSPTAGANGDVTNFSVPGDIWISFSGQGVTHADGRQLQRIGLMPDVEAHPTIKGIREGRDEVLERAIRYVESGK